MRFAPQANDRLHIDSEAFKVTPHPQVPSMAFGQEGRKSVVYQLARGSDDRLFALKVFKKAYQGPYLKGIAERIEPHADLPGMSACQRTVITQRAHPDLVERYPDIRYAVLMPWVGEKTWQDIILSETSLAEAQSVTLARYCAYVLATLEEEGLAHCDISGGNVMLDMSLPKVHLVDLEDIYDPGLPPPKSLPAGSLGYQHRVSQDGQWCAEGDRFAGAVLLAEMLTWHHPRIREEAHGEHYFSSEELQDPASGRYELLLSVLRQLSDPLSDLFQQAWGSTDLAGCPPLGQWFEELNRPSLHAKRGQDQAAGDLPSDPMMKPVRRPLDRPWLDVSPADAADPFEGVEPIPPRPKK